MTEPITYPIYELRGRKTMPDPPCGKGTLDGARLVLELHLSQEIGRNGKPMRSAIEAKTKQSRPVSMTAGATFMEATRIKTLRTSVRRGVESGLDAYVALHGVRPALARLRVVRLSNGKLDDTNLVGACKPIEDGVADAFGVNDKHFSMFGEAGKIAYEPRQEHCKRGVKGIRVEIEFARASERTGT